METPSFAVVTDSAADLPLELARKHGIHIVPLHVNVDGRDLRDAYDIRIDGFLDRLERGGDLPVTSAPAPADFLAAYEGLIRRGFTQILSIHLSGALSSTVEQARTIAERLAGAAAAPGSRAARIEVVDSRSATATQGLMALEAAEIARRGGTLDEARERACAIRDAAKIYFIPATLDNLVKGGRASKLQGLATSLLNIKVVIEVTGDGRVDLVHKARGMRNAVTWIARQMAARSRELGRLVYYKLHTRGGEALAMLDEAVAASGVDGRCLTMGTIGPVIATHVGRGAVGLFCCPERLHAPELDDDIREYLAFEN